LYTTFSKSMPAVKNVVLVHGAWADGSCWAKIIPVLQREGLHVVAVQLTLGSIADDVAATKRILDAQDGPVLLAGHSYGGVVITEAGNHPKVEGLVYVAAFAPDEGETVGGLAGGYPPQALFGELNPIEDGYLLLTAKGVSQFFAQDLTATETGVMAATQGATQGAILATPVTAAAWRHKPNWVVISENDMAIAPDQQRFTAERMGAKVLTVPTSHVPMLSQPNKVADFMLEAIATLAGAR
jgi:pimeloyl-ACP methyl ester carboxylesterase